MRSRCITKLDPTARLADSKQDLLCCSIIIEMIRTSFALRRREHRIRLSEH